MPKAVAKNYSFHKDVGICIFCNTGEEEVEYCGRLLTDKNETLSVHNYCLLFASGLSQNGKDSEGIDGFLLPDILDEYRRGKKLRCYYCGKKTATIGCSGLMCRKGFHFNCAFKREAMFLFFNTFLAYCKDHRPQQNVTIKPSDPATVPCPICMEDVEAKVSNHALKTPCCNNTWFHRTCVQSQALSSGYFFRCAICNNQDQFQEEMKNFGIYIPEHDASWEQEENAFQDLYWRHDTCDIEPCKCPDGKNFNKASSKWELVLCDICGSSGCHIACGGLQSPNQDWACAMCSAMLSNATEANCTSAGSPKKSPVATKESPKMTGQSTRTAMKLMGKHPRTPLSSHLCRKKVATTSPQTSTKLSKSPVGFCSPIQDSVPNLNEMLDCCRPSTSGQGKDHSKRKMKKKRKLSFNSKENYSSTSPNVPESRPYKKHCTWKRKNADLQDYMKSTSNGLKYGPRTTLRMSMRPRNIPQQQNSPSKLQVEMDVKQTAYSFPKDAVRETCKTKPEVTLVSGVIINSTLTATSSKEEEGIPNFKVFPPVTEATISFSSDKSHQTSLLCSPKADYKSIKEDSTSILKRHLADAKIKAASSKKDPGSAEFEALPQITEATISSSPEKCQLHTLNSDSEPIKEIASSLLKRALSPAKIKTASSEDKASSPEIEILPPVSKAVIQSSPDKCKLLTPKSGNKPIEENSTKIPLTEAQINWSSGHPSESLCQESCADTDMSSADPDSSWTGCRDFDSESANSTDVETSVALSDEYIHSSEYLAGPRTNVEACLNAKQRNSLYLIQLSGSDSCKEESPRKRTKRHLKKETEEVIPSTNVTDQFEKGYAGKNSADTQKQFSLCNGAFHPASLECEPLFSREDDSSGKIISTKPEENISKVSKSPVKQETSQSSLNFNSDKKNVLDRAASPVEMKLNGRSQESRSCSSLPKVTEFETSHLTGTLRQGNASTSGENVQQDPMTNLSDQVEEVSMLNVVDEGLKGKSTPEKALSSLVSHGCTSRLPDASPTDSSNDESGSLKCKRKDKSRTNNNKSGPRKNSMSLKKQKKTKTGKTILKIKMDLATSLARRKNMNTSNHKDLVSKGHAKISDPRERFSSTPETPMYLDGNSSVDWGSGGSAARSDGSKNRTSTDQIANASLACSNCNTNWEPMDQDMSSPTTPGGLDQNISLDENSASVTPSNPDENRNLENEVLGTPITPSKQDKCSISLDQVTHPPSLPSGPECNGLVDHEAYSEPPTPSNRDRNRSPIDQASSAPATPNNRGKKGRSLDMGPRRCSTRITIKHRRSQETQKKSFIKQQIAGNENKTISGRNKTLSHLPNVERSNKESISCHQEPSLKDKPSSEDKPVSPRLNKIDVTEKNRQRICEEERLLVKGRNKDCYKTVSWLSGSLLRKSCSKHLAQKESSQEYYNKEVARTSFKQNQEAAECSSEETTFALLDQDDDEISFSKEYQSQSNEALATPPKVGSLEASSNDTCSFSQNLLNEVKGTSQSSPNLKDLCSREETTSPDLFDSGVDINEMPVTDTHKKNNADGHGGVINGACIKRIYPDSRKSKVNTKRKSMQGNSKYVSTESDDLKMEAKSISSRTRSSVRRSNQVPPAAQSANTKHNSVHSTSTLTPATPMRKPTERTAAWTFNCGRGNIGQNVNCSPLMPRSCPGKYRSTRSGSGDGEFEKMYTLRNSYTKKLHSRVCAKLFRSWEEERRHHKQF